jgi:hypothetical protein
MVFAVTEYNNNQFILGGLEEEMESVLKTVSEKKVFLLSRGRVTLISMILFFVFIGYILPDQVNSNRKKYDHVEGWGPIQTYR